MIDEFLNDSTSSDFISLIKEECKPFVESGKRRVSETLLKLLALHYPQLADLTVCPNFSDTAGLKTIIGNRIEEFGKFDDENFTLRLKKLKLLLTAMYPNEKTLQVTLSAYASLFKKYHIPLSSLESDTGGPHISIVRTILRLDGPRQVPQFVENLKDKFTENLDENQIVGLFDYGMNHESKTGYSKLLLSLICMTGSRKSEILRSDIWFHKAPSDTQTFILGNLCDENHIYVGSAILPDFIIAQSGKCKDKTTRINQELTEHIELLFPKSFKKAKEDKISLLSHFCRKLYAHTAYKKYKNKICECTGKKIDKSIFLACVLGHSDLTSVPAYSNVGLLKTKTQLQDKVMDDLLH